MAKKKKDTLKDLNAFMQSQSKEADAQSGDYIEKQPTTLTEVESINNALQRLKKIPEGELKEDAIVDLIQVVATANNLSTRTVLLKIFLKAVDTLEMKDASDIMLKNTLLYLEYQDRLNQKIEK